MILAANQPLPELKSVAGESLQRREEEADVGGRSEGGELAASRRRRSRETRKKAAWRSSESRSSRRRKSSLVVKVVGAEVRSRRREDSGAQVRSRCREDSPDLRFRVFVCWAGKKLGQGPKPGRNGKNPDRMGKTRTK